MWVVAEHLIRELVTEVIKKIKEVDITGGKRTKLGSSEHIRDLKARIGELTAWRDRQRRGSEQRANYSRLISRLKGELASAKRASEKKTMKESKWWKDPTLLDPEHENFIGVEAKYEKMAENPEFKHLLDPIKNAADPAALAKAKRAVLKAIDEGDTSLPDGVWMFFHKKRRDELTNMNVKPQSVEQFRKNNILNTYDSTGKAKPRKW